MLPVFAKGTWIDFPKHTDPLWSYANQLQAGSAYASALSKGYSAEESEGLAIALVNKTVYKGLVYMKSLEQKLSKITDLSETS